MNKCGGLVIEHQVKRDKVITKDQYLEQIKPILEKLKLVDEYVYLKDKDKFVKATDYESLLKEDQSKEENFDPNAKDLISTEETLEMVIGEEEEQEEVIKLEDYPFFLKKMMFE